MSRVPEPGDDLLAEDVETIMEAVATHQRNFPNTPAMMSITLIMMNIGKRYSKITCQEGEWESILENIKAGEGDPKCPNGHDLIKGPGLKLVWSLDRPVVTENEDDNCQVWYEVDFGKGPVEVRCTKAGPHKKHGTETFFI